MLKTRNQSLGAAVFSQADAFSVIGETQEVLVQNPADELVDSSTDVDQQQ